MSVDINESDEEFRVYSYNNVESPLPQRHPAKADEPSVPTRHRCAQEECLLVSTSLSVR